MINYDKSTIYKLCCKDPSITDEYVGSTVNFTRRKATHKNNCYNEKNNGYKFKVYQKIRECGGWDNWDMVELERYSAVDRKDLHSHERFWLEELGATLNCQIPTRGKKEYRDNNKEKMKEYRQKNKEKIAKKEAEYRQKNKEKNREKIAEYKVQYYKDNKKNIAEYKAQWYNNNKKKILERRDEYYANNKKKIAEKLKEKVTCECGTVVKKCCLTRHKKTQKHLKFIEQKLTINLI